MTVVVEGPLKGQIGAEETAAGSNIWRLKRLVTTIAAGTYDVHLDETQAGYSNSPRRTTRSVTVSAPTPTPVIPSASDDPDIAGSTTVGSTLTRTDAADWTGAQSIALQWYRGTTAISGANGASYVTQSIDVGQAIKLRETATSSTGHTAFAESNAITVTNAQTPTPTPTPGDITASSGRRAVFSETQDATSRTAGVPFGAVVLTAPMDPHTRKDIAGDFSRVLGGGKIVEIISLTVNPIGFGDGFRVMTDPAPFLSAEGDAIQFRGEVLSNRQNDAIFNGTGTQADVTIFGRQDDDQTVQHTLIVPLRNL